MEISVLERLVPLLHQHRVYSFKDGNTEIYFQCNYPIEVAPKQTNDIPSIAPKEPLHAADPENFKADELMAFDQVLNWSAPQTGGEVQIPLTGTAPTMPADKAI